MRNVTGIREKFKAIAPGQTITAIANLLHVSHNTARDWARLVGYEARDGRGKEFWADNHPGGHRKADWTKADWTQEDPQIAEALGVSRARVWQKRRTLARFAAQAKPQPTPETK
jgi:hypothetical protein